MAVGLMAVFEAEPTPTAPNSKAISSGVMRLQKETETTGNMDDANQ